MAGQPSQNNSAFHVEVCGGIASGKTTLATVLNSPRLAVALENFSENPFWQAFYKDPVGNALETEIVFLLQHYHHIKMSKRQSTSFICDFSLYLDLAYAMITLDESGKNIFESIFAEINRHISRPALIVRLKCSPETELQRIRSRGRAQERAITVDYLSRLELALEAALKRAQSMVVTIDSEQIDFRNDSSVVREILATTTADIFWRATAEGQSIVLDSDGESKIRV